MFVNFLIFKILKIILKIVIKIIVIKRSLEKKKFHDARGRAKMEGNLHGNFRMANLLNKFIYGVFCAKYCVGLLEHCK